jgi:hypothetical protein
VIRAFVRYAAKLSRDGLYGWPLLKRLWVTAFVSPNTSDPRESSHLLCSRPCLSDWLPLLQKKRLSRSSLVAVLLLGHLSKIFSKSVKIVRQGRHNRLTFSLVRSIHLFLTKHSDRLRAVYLRTGNVVNLWICVGKCLAFATCCGHRNWTDVCGRSYKASFLHIRCHYKL